MGLPGSSSPWMVDSSEWRGIIGDFSEAMSFIFLGS